MDSISLASRTGVTLELTPIRRPHGSGRGRFPSWQAHIAGAGLDAYVVLSEEGWQEQSLAAFLAALDSDWRGWDGERVWQSPESYATRPHTTRRTRWSSPLGLATARLLAGRPKPRWSSTPECSA